MPSATLAQQGRSGDGRPAIKQGLVMFLREWRNESINCYDDNPEP